MPGPFRKSPLVFSFLSILSVTVFLLSAAGQTAPPKKKLSGGTVEERIDSLLAQMTTAEKFGQLNQLSGGGTWNEAHTAVGISPEQEELVRKGLVGSFLNVTGAEKTRQAQRIAVEESRLGVPLIFGFDVIHGYRTIFPVPLAEASTWDPELVKNAARVAAIEASAAGLHWTFAPMVDIARDARWGRIVEGSGEDPYLGSLLASARVKGFQGDTFEIQGSILACAKHFAAYGGAEGGRDYNIVDISERTLHEIYLPPFKAAVDAGVQTIMTSFNEIAGVPSTGNRKLVTAVLRNQWGFKGFVVSDWTSVNELRMHGIAGTRAEAGRLALNAGVDMDMESKIYVNDLAELLRQNRILQQTLDESVRRILLAKFKLGLFENPYRYSDPEREKRMILHPEHRSVARKVAQKSIVLLKNENNILPLSKNVRSIALLGPLADEKQELLGPWNGIGKAEDVIAVLQAMRSKVSAQTEIRYAKGCGLLEECGPGIAEAKSLASKADAVVLAVGEPHVWSGEAASRSNIDLPGNQEKLVRAVCETRKPVIVILMNGRPLTIPWIAENIPAILETWFLGVEAGNAIADVLFGDVNPGGKLPVTFPRTIGQIPIYYNHKNTGRPVSNDKFTSKYLDIPNTPLYPFGFGLSYTSFAYSNLNVNPPRIGPQERLAISIEVKNTGSRSGEEVIQLYIQDKVASVTRPVKELKDFQKITLRPGEKKTATFSISPEQLSFYNQDMNRITEPGAFAVYVGPNSRDVLQAEFELLSQ